MNDSGNNLLSQLRDIHAASEPGWWPPAPGWWVLAILLVLALALVLRLVRRRWLDRLRRQRLLTALDKLAVDVDPVISPQQYLSGINSLFRIVALRAFPDTACARFQGDEWVRFIHSMLPRGVSAEGLAALASGPYQPGPEFDVGQLHRLARAWVAKYG